MEAITVPGLQVWRNDAECLLIVQNQASAPQKKNIVKFGNPTDRD